jgi:hypothetical protein
MEKTNFNQKRERLPPRENEKGDREGIWLRQRAPRFCFAASWLADEQQCCGYLWSYPIPVSFSTKNYQQEIMTK